jgi:tripartite-type tricarboxylate transporter receptor subunit TctC
MLGSSPEALGTFIRDEIDRWTPIIKKLGIKPD